jgi:hypothetical protein
MDPIIRKKELCLYGTKSKLKLLKTNLLRLYFQVWKKLLIITYYLFNKSLLLSFFQVQ